MYITEWDYSKSTASGANKCNINHKFKNIDQLSQMVNYRPMVNNIDPLASQPAISDQLRIFSQLLEL